jgi:hypothetical protein
LPLLLLILGPANGQERAGSGPVLQYRQQLVPESEVELRVQQGYMAMRRERFEQMLKEINGQSAGRSGEPVVRIQRAVYTARWDDGHLVDGEAELDIHLSGSAPAPLSLSPLGVAIARPQWTDDATRTPVLGLESSGNIVLLVERSGTLSFSWSLQVQPGSGRTDVFRLLFPPAPSNELRLALPADRMPVVDQGFVEPLEQPAGEPAAPRVWLLQLRGESPAELQIVPREVPPAHRRLILTRQASRYAVTNAGLEYQTTFSLDVHNQPLKALAIEVDPELRVLGARLGQAELPVRLSPAAAVSAEGATEVPAAGERLDPESESTPARLPGSSPLRMVLELPTAVQGLDRELVITAFAPLVVDTPWRLPSLRAVDVVWQQGTAALDVPHTLLLKKLTLESGIETAIESLPQQGESRKLLLYKPTAAIEVTLGYTPKQVSLVSGTTLRLNPSIVTARQVVNLTGTRGATFALEGRIPNGWIIDHIEASPAGALEPISPWTVRGRRLQIQFKDGVTAARPVQMTLTAHRHVVSLPLSGSDFRLVEFERIGQRRELIAVCPDERHHLVIHRNADVPRLAVESLPATEQPLLEATEGALIYADSPPAKDFLVGVNFENPRYAGTIDSEACVDAHSLRQTYRIRVEPAGSQVSRVLVHFSQQGTADTHWRLVADTGVGLATRQLRESEADAGETWELTLVRARGEPFEIEAVRLGEFQSSGHVALASLPEAASQSATVRIGAADGSPLSVRTENLKSIPVERASTAAYTKVRAAYRYDPARNAVAHISRAEGTVVHHSAWVWQADLVTRLDGDGGVTNVAVYQLENTGRSQVAITLPPEARFWHVTIDGSDLTAESSGKPPRPLLVRLPREVRFPILRIRYVTSHPVSGVVGQLKPDWPSLDVPCVRGTWSVWLPSAYAAWPNEHRLSYGSVLRSRWDQRLFGYPLQRRSGRPFNLFSYPDWQTVLGAIDPGAEAEVAAAAALARMQTAYTRRIEDSNRVPTWGELVQDLASGDYGEARRPWAVWVDSAGMRDVRVTSLTPIDIGEGQAPWNPQELLAATGTALVVAADGTLLTNRDSLSRFIAGASPVPFRNVVYVADLPALLAMWPEGRQPVPTRMWATATPLPQSPWALPLESQLLDLPLTGWHNHRVAIDPSEPASLTIYQPRFVELLGGVLLLGVAGLASAFLRNRSRWLLLGAGCFTAVTLLCPLELVPVARGVLLGLMLALAWTAVGRVPRLRGPLRSSESSIAKPLSGRSLAATTLQVLLLVLAIALAAQSVVSAQTTPTPTPSPATAPDPPRRTRRYRQRIHRRRGLPPPPPLRRPWRAHLRRNPMHWFHPWTTRGNRRAATSIYRGPSTSRCTGCWYLPASRPSPGSFSRPLTKSLLTWIRPMRPGTPRGSSPTSPSPYWRPAPAFACHCLAPR